MQLGVIPARYESQRFPGKPLVDILGTPMVVRTWKQVVHKFIVFEILDALMQGVTGSWVLQGDRKGFDYNFYHLQRILGEFHSTTV